jgi:Mn2+/Fe2+ NRAMP family transporter
MFTVGDPEVLAKEKRILGELETKGVLPRWKWYFSKSGPGWMQSAMTLGGGSAFASLYAGSFMQYKLLWVQPLAMLMGIIMLSSLSYQTLSSGERPFEAMRKYLHPSIAWAWAIGTLLSSIIWHFPQYSLIAGMSEDMLGAVTGKVFTGTAQTLLMLFFGILYLCIAVCVCWSYGQGGKGVRRFETIIKSTVWFIILCFTIVVVRKSIDGGVAWGDVLKGFIPLSIPKDKQVVSIVMAGLSAAVGINMTFLFGYSYLARGWGKEHRGLARFDLLTGMLFPYVLATSLMIIAAGCTIYDPDSAATTKISPVQMAELIQSAGLPMFFSRIVFGFGIIGMAFNAIIMHMLVSGFAVCEVFGVEPGGWKYKLACLVPAPGLLGVILWKYLGTWIAIPTSAICLLLLPIAYIGFFLLNNSKRYLGLNKPTGPKAFAWNTAMVVSILVIIVSGLYYLIGVMFPFIQGLLGSAQ